MNNGLLHGLAVVLIVLLVVLYLRAGKRPAPYRLSEKWTHAPILWTATGEVLPGGHASHGGAGDNPGAVNVGGGASGSW